jgi:putative tryptophan/tyrosine transport system substrate-binding protein
MNRRTFLIAGASVAVPVPSAFAQVTRRPVRIAVLSSTTPEARSVFWEKFKQELTALGWIEGRDVVYVYRYTRGDSARFDPLAAELVAEKPDLFFAATDRAAAAAKRVTASIPIVFAYVTDPVSSGLVASLARPGGNATGLSSLFAETSVKHLELLKELQPRLRRVTVVALATPLGQRAMKATRERAQSMGAEVHTVSYAGTGKPDEVLEEVAGSRADGVLFLNSPFIERRKFTESIAKLRVPAVYGASEMVEAGGLVAYGAERGDNFRRAADYVDRILKGAKPGDLPVQQPQVFELAVNLKAARELGIAIPHSVLLRATKIIE